MDLQRLDSYQGGAGPDFHEHVLHKTILVGDSGVGKTSLLVQFDQGKFVPGSFSATVGIGFTACSRTRHREAQGRFQAPRTPPPTHPTPGTCGPRAGWSSGVACWPRWAATTRAPARGPSDARPSPEGGVPRDSSPWYPNPGSWRPWGAVLGWIWPTPSDWCGSRGLPAPSRADSAVLRAPAGQPAPRQRCSGGGTEGGACRGPGPGRWRGEEAGGASGGAVPAGPSAAAGPSSPLVQGHDGHAWHRGHPGWRGPRALPTLRAEPRSHGQGDASGRLRRRQNLFPHPIQRRGLPVRDLHSHRRHRLQEQGGDRGWCEGEAADLGHRRSGAVPQRHPRLLPRRPGLAPVVRHHQQIFLRQHPGLAH